MELALSRPWPSHCPRLPPSPVAVSFCCSSVATCPLPAHSPLLLRRSSLPLASLQTLPFASLQTLNTLRWGIRLPRFKHLKLFKPYRSLAAASTKPSGRQPLLFQHWRALCLHIALCCYGVQACRLPAFKPCRLPAFKPLTPSVGAFVCHASNT